MKLKTKWLLKKKTSTSCTMTGVWKAVAFCQGVVVVFHSPAGCAHVASFLDLGERFRILADGGLDVPSAVPLVSSALREKDSIFGGADRLRACLADAWESYHPKCFVVASSCVAGVIGDDVDWVCAEAERKYGIPVLSMPFSGFLGGDYGDGYDQTANAIMKRFFRRQAHVPRRVMLLGDQMGPMGQYAREVTRILRKFGLDVRYQFPGYVPFDAWQEIPSAEFSILLGFSGNPGSLEKMAKHLEQSFGVRSLGAVFPVGWQETKDWIEKVACLTGQEARGKAILAEEEAELARQTSIFQKQTAGRTAAIVTGRSPRWYDPAETAATLLQLGIRISALILLNNLPPEDKEHLAASFHRASNAPVLDGADGGSVMDDADLLLVSNEIYSAKTKQLFLPMVPLAGTAGEIAMMRAIAHLVCRYGTKGGIAYVEA